MKIPTKVFLPPDTIRKLDALSERSGRGKSEITRAAIESYLSPDSAEAAEAAMTRRLDRMARQLDRIERDVTIVTEAVAAFVPRQGEVLDHQQYEASKRSVAGALLHHGYFDADLAAHRVEVTRADFAADIDLRWTSGERFLLGA